MIYTSPEWHPFSLGYGVILQSSLAIVLSLTSGSSPCPCVSIFGTGPSRYARSFSWKTSQSFSVLAAAFRMRRALASCAADLPAARLLRLPRLFRQPVAPAVSVTPSLSMGYGNLHPSSIGYAFRAGQNLPDKEFRYLRTVIVTAAVYRGFNSSLLLR